MRRFGRRPRVKKSVPAEVYKSGKYEDLGKLLGLFLSGGIVLFMLQQAFYTDNKTVDHDYILHSEINKQNFELINRLVNFYWHYDIEGQANFKDVEIGSPQSDTPFVYWRIPRFIKDSNERKYFLEDIAEFKKSRNLIDATITVKLRPVFDLIDVHQLPPVNRDSIINSIWFDLDFQDKWSKATEEFNDAAATFMHLGRE